MQDENKVKEASAGLIERTVITKVSIIRSWAKFSLGLESAVNQFSLSHKAIKLGKKLSCMKGKGKMNGKWYNSKLYETDKSSWIEPRFF